MKRVFSITFSLILLVLSAKAQTKYNEAEFKTKPVWIIMMDDSAVNYNQAVKAFDMYWEGRVKPEEDADKLHEKNNSNKEKDRKRYEKKLAKMTPAERNEFDRVNYQYKRFVNWMFEVKPYVQADRRILTRQQRLDIRNKQQQQMKKQRG